MATKSIMFRSTKIRRIYDSSSNSLVYVSYRDALSSSEDESMDKNRYATSIAVVREKIKGGFSSALPRVDTGSRRGRATASSTKQLQATQ